MPQSRLFVSSVSRRDVARRRPGRWTVPAYLLVIALLVVAGALAFIVGRGGI
jgi:hypothetical protein